MNIKRMREELLRFLCLMNFMCKILTSETEEISGEAVTAVLMDPLSLGHRATHPIKNTEKKPFSRPLTPRPNVLSLSPLNLDSSSNPLAPAKETKKNSEFGISMLEKPSVTEVEPLKSSMAMSSGSKKSLKSKSLWHLINNNLPISSDQFYAKMEEVILAADSDACLCIASRPEMRQLSAEKLLDLLERARRLSMISTRSNHLFRELFTEVVVNIVPSTHPESFKKFIMMAVKKHVSINLLVSACKHIKLLSNNDLNELIHEIEMKFVWERLERIGIPDMSSFNAMIMEIAINMENSENVLNFDHVVDVLSVKEASSTGYIFSSTLKRLKIVYMTTFMVSTLKSANSENSDEEIMRSLTVFFEIGSKELQLNIEIILEHIEQVWKVILPSAKPEQTEVLGRFLKILHEVILNQKSLPYIPSKMVGIEDLYIYFEENLVNLVKARLKFYRSSKITKLQLLSLLNKAEILDDDNSTEFMIILLGSVNVSKQSITDEDLKSIFVGPRILLEGMFTFPAKYSGDICTSDINFKQSEKFIWKLPADLFINEDSIESSGIFLLSEIFSQLPRLFLFRVFGLPMNSFSKIYIGMNELPEAQELIDTVNFFLERWCATNSKTEIYPVLKIISADNAEI